MNFLTRAEFHITAPYVSILLHLPLSHMKHVRTREIMPDICSRSCYARGALTCSGSDTAVFEREIKVKRQSSIPSAMG